MAVSGRCGRLGAAALAAVVLLAGARSAEGSPAAMRAPPRLAAPAIPARLETSTLALGARLALDVYRRRVSPLTSGRCGFSPSCSSYALEALRRLGPLAGAPLIGDRLTRCNIFKGPRDYAPLPDGRLRDPLEDHLR